MDAAFELAVHHETNEARRGDLARRRRDTRCSIPVGPRHRDGELLPRDDTRMGAPPAYCRPDHGEIARMTDGRPTRIDGLGRDQT